MAAYSSRTDAALTLAARAHRNQTRKGTDTPYVVHPVHVALILLRYGFPEDLVVAGLLHDVVEDQDVPLGDIKAEFGPEVAAIVGALSERKREGQTPRPWIVRKEEALEQLRRAGPEAAAVKAADVLHNARSLAAHLRRAGPAAWEHYKRGAEETLWYYRSVTALAHDRVGDHPLIDELDGAIEDLERAIGEAQGI